MDNAEELLNRQVAAEWLNQQLSEKSVEQWVLWLRNNANSARPAKFRIATVTIGRGTFYRVTDLEKFVEFEKGRQLGAVKLTGRAAEVLQAFGIGEEGSSTSGRRWKGGSANVANNGSVFVQVIVNEPLSVFRVEPADAIAFGQELVEAGKAAQRIAGETPAHATVKFETVADTPDALIERRKPE